MADGKPLNSEQELNNPDPEPESASATNIKRPLEAEVAEPAEPENTKKPKLDSPMEQEHEHEHEEEEEEEEAGDSQKEKETKKEVPVKLGPKIFHTSVEMVDYFHKLLQSWPLNLNLNMYEQMVLRDLLAKGHHDAEKKIGPGVRSFQVRIHPEYDVKCFFFTRADGVSDDFSYRKCIDSLIPLPENMKLGKNGKHGGQQKKHGHGGKRGGRGRGRGRGGFRHGKRRNH